MRTGSMLRRTFSLGSARNVGDLSTMRQESDGQVSGEVAGI